MKLILDMNLSPSWVERLRAAGWEAEHWSRLGNPRAPDREVLAAVVDQNAWLLTADLDFGAILAARGEHRPSVVLLRLQDLSADHALDLVLGALERFGDELERGALLSLDERGGRIRLLPLRASSPRP